MHGVVVRVLFNAKCIEKIEEIWKKGLFVKTAADVGEMELAFTSTYSPLQPMCLAIIEVDLHMENASNVDFQLL